MAVGLIDRTRPRLDSRLCDNHASPTDTPTRLLGPQYVPPIGEIACKQGSDPRASCRPTAPRRLFGQCACIRFLAPRANSWMRCSASIEVGASYLDIWDRQAGEVCGFDSATGARGKQLDSQHVPGDAHRLFAEVRAGKQLTQLVR